MINYEALLIAVLFNIFLNLIAIKFWGGFEFVKHYEKVYSGIQKIHSKKIIPRLGGLNSYLSLVLYASISTLHSNYFLITLLFSLLILVIYSTKEDIAHNVTPYKRILSIFLTSFIFLIAYKNLNLPIIDAPILGKILNIYVIAFVFFIFALVSIANGTNIIDGANGLSGMTVLFQLISLLILADKVSDTFIYSNLIILIVFLIVFLAFNFPMGKIFLGDSGAYMWGWISGLMVILFYGRHPELPTWGAIVILIYPIIETIFSTIRKKFYENISPLTPDPYHLHLKVYFFLQKLLRSKRIKLSANNIVTLALLPIWSSPLYLIPFVYSDNFLITLALLYVCILYFTIYIFTPRVK